MRVKMVHFFKGKVCKVCKKCKMCQVFPLQARLWPRGWVEVYLYSSMTAALEGGEWSAAHPSCTLPPGERPGTYCTGSWVGPRAGLDGWKISPHWDLIPRPSSL